MPSNSIVWKFFSLQADKTTVVCRLCSHKMTYSHRSTSNMRRHLKVKNTIQHDAEMEKNKPAPLPSTSSFGDALTTSSKPAVEQQTLFQCVERGQKYKPDSTKKKAIDELIVKMIIEDTRPISTVEDAGFRRLVHFLDPRYEMIERTSIAKLLPTMYGRKKEEIKQNMANAVSISITTDHWTSTATENYTTVTAHYINQGWNMQSKVLMTRSSGQQQITELLTQELKECFAEFGISDKIAFITTENARNIVNAVKLIATHQPCFAHTLNLAVTDAIKK